jgi:hypothetical protein
MLVYLFNITPALATSYSLFIVGCTSIVGGIRKAVEGTVDFKMALVFTVPSFAGAFISRVFILNRIPDTILPGSAAVTKDALIMIVFALVMLAASVSMLYEKRYTPGRNDTTSFNPTMISFLGFGVGLLTGIVGVGGGFLIIPSLVLFARLPMKKAIGTSLVIIASKSMIGFLADVQSHVVMDYSFISIISAVAIAGILVGNYWSKFIGGPGLKKAFGWFMMIVSVYILIGEVFG